MDIVYYAYVAVGSSTIS